MRRISSKLGIMFFAVALALPLAAQSNKTYLADIPFDFTMGRAALPAGHYEIQVEPAQSLVTLMGSDRHRSVVLSLPEAAYEPGSQQPKLTFNRYGDQYFLSQIRTTDSARMIPLTQTERELQKSAAASGRNRIVLAMR